MASNIVIRTAKKDYVCDCCGKIIKTGTEYLDKVTLNDGKCVRHERYHDECPRDSAPERVFKKLFAHTEKYEEPMQVLDIDGHVCFVYGLEFFDGAWYAKMKYKDQPVCSHNLLDFIKNCHDENGDML